MRILLVTETYLPFISGVATSTDSIARYMVSRGHTVTLVSPRPIIAGTVPTAPGLTFVHIPSLPDMLYSGKPTTVFPMALPAFFRLLQGAHFDVVHIQEPGSIGVCALIAAKKFRVPAVGALHFTPDQIARMITGRNTAFIRAMAERYIAWIYNKYSAIMVPTQTFADFLHTLGVKKPVEVVSNGVDTTVYTPAQRNETLRKTYGIAGSDTLFFYLGRIDKDKNVATLLAAMRYVDTNVKLLIAGKGKMKDELVAYAKNHMLEDRIRWVGNVTAEQMIGLYHAADVFTLMAEFEIQSIVTLQALSCGLPVLLADAGALPELVREGENGYLVPPHDDKQLAQRMNELAADPALRTRMGAVSREISLAHHKPTVLGKLEKLYESVIAGVQVARR